MLPELTEYRVIATVKGESLNYCDCPHCDGHDPKTAIEEVDYVIKAIDEADAKRLAELEYKTTSEYGFVEWVNLVILAPGEKPPWPREVELVYLDRWNKGLGLPAEPVIA